MVFGHSRCFVIHTLRAPRAPLDSIVIIDGTMSQKSAGGAFFNCLRLLQDFIGRHKNQWEKLFLIPAFATPGTTTSASAISAATSTSTSTATTTTIFARARFVYGERSTFDILTTQSGNRRLSLLIRTHFHEPETLGATGITIHDYLSRHDRTELFEKLLKITVSYAVGKVSHIQLLCHVGRPPEKKHTRHTLCPTIGRCSQVHMVTMICDRKQEKCKGVTPGVSIPRAPV